MTDRRGWTFTELLCVMAIILIVWGALLPAMVAARNRADETSCANRLHNIGMGLRLYAQDHAGHLPPEGGGLRALLPRYIDDPAVFHCPSVESARSRFGKYMDAPPEPWIDYAYRPGLATDDHPRLAVAWDDAARHHGAGSVLYLSSRVASVPEAELPTLGGGPSP